MEVGSSSHLQGLLRAAVQSVQWTYSLFWQYSHQQRTLIWAEGYYNGAIKTRKTVQSLEGGAEAASLQRSHQLRELYESLSAGDIAPPQRRPSASLLPEDLTETEWFYLMCVSFSFQLGEGLPGKAYLRRQHVWLSEAAQSNDKIFTRAILAKSARVQTVVCIPLMDGVVEFGYTEKVEEDLGFIRHVVRSFQQGNCQPQPAFLVNSTSSQVHSTKEQLGFASNEEEDDNDYEGDEEPSELMQLEMPEEFQNSPEGIESDCNMIQAPTPPPTLSFDVLSADDKHYSETISSVLKNRPAEQSQLTWHSSSESVFTKWTSSWASDSQSHRNNTPSQWLLKHILFSVPCLHPNHNEDNHVPTASERLAQEDSSASHVMAERRRREKLNERFFILRAMLPSATKSDKASILTDIIAYVEQLKDKVQDLGSRNDELLKLCYRTAKQPETAPLLETMTCVEVSIIGADALIEMQCRNREGLLLDVVQSLRVLKVETTAILSSINGEILVAEIRAKVNGNGVEKVSIKEVKQVINRIIPEN